MKPLHYLCSMLLLALTACSLANEKRADKATDKDVYQEYLQVEVSPDVDSLHTFTDFLGINYKVLIAFKCSPITISKIVNKNGLVLLENSNDGGLFFSDKFYWWNKKVTSDIKPYRKEVSNGDRIYLWYDKSTGNAYYEQFSI